MRPGPLTALVLALLVTISIAQSDVFDDNDGLITGSPLRLNGQHDHPRGPSRFQYSISLLAKENSRLRLGTFNQSGAVYWAFAKFKQGDSMDTAPAPLPLFHLSNPAIRNNQSIRESFACSPSESQCNEITVGRFDNFKYLGSYSYQSFINTLDSLYVDYNISMAVSKTRVECSGVNEPTACSITPETISVKSGQEVKVTCSIVIAQNSPYDVSLDYVMASACPNAKSTIEQINRPGFVATPNEDSTNVIFYRVSKTCFRQFDKYDHNTEFKCELKSTNQSSVPLELQPWDTYDQASLRLDVHYGPELTPTSPHHYNQTLIVGTNRMINFSCPYVANPDPEYFWRVAYVSYNQNQSHAIKGYTPAANNRDIRDRRQLSTTEFLSSGRDYSIPNNLEIGTYVFECKAKSKGLIVNATSDIAKFYLNIIPNPVNVKKDSRNIGAIVGGVIGGLLAIIILVLGIVYFIKKYRNDNSMDEIEKAKEIDIDINDRNNLHFNKTKDQPDGGVVDGSKQQQHQQINHHHQMTNGLSHKVAASLMMPSTTIKSYAAIASQAAAAAAQQRNNHAAAAAAAAVANAAGWGGGGNAVVESNGNLLFNQHNKSYNNPGFFESSTSYHSIIQNHLESPPPYEPAPNQPVHQHQHQQSAAVNSTPKKHLPNTPGGSGGGAGSMNNLQYTTVQDIDGNRSRSRNALNHNMDSEQQYTTVAQLNPINV